MHYFTRRRDIQICIFTQFISLIAVSSHQHSGYMRKRNKQCYDLPGHSLAGLSRWNWPLKIWAELQTVPGPAWPGVPASLKGWWAVPCCLCLDSYAEAVADRNQLFRMPEVFNKYGKFSVPRKVHFRSTAEKTFSRYFLDLNNLTSNICAKWVSLLENMAWMQWMAYLAWRGGPFFALSCSTGKRTLGGKMKSNRQEWMAHPTLWMTVQPNRN